MACDSDNMVNIISPDYIHTTHTHTISIYAISYYCICNCKPFQTQLGKAKGVSSEVTAIAHFVHISTGELLFYHKSSQVTFIYIALFTIQIVSKQLHSDNMNVIQHRSIILLNIKMFSSKQAQSKATVARNQNSIR